MTWLSWAWRAGPAHPVLAGILGRATTQTPREPPQFVWHLLTETGYYLIMGAMPDGVQRQANLRALVDKTESFCENGQQSLFSLLRYIDSVRSRNVKTGQVRLLSEKDDVVRIMTIHKSKGLEFPMVITAGMGRRLNYTRSGGKVVFHKDIISVNRGKRKKPDFEGCGRRESWGRRIRPGGEKKLEWS